MRNRDKFKRLHKLAIAIIMFENTATIKTKNSFYHHNNGVFNNQQRTKIDKKII